MARRSLVTLVTVAALTVLGATARSQDTPKSEATKAPEAATPRQRKVPALLRAQITITRFQGDRKVASVPYSVLVTTDEKRVGLRMGVEVPIPVTSFTTASDGKSVPATSFQYRNMGTNIDCSAEDRSGDGLFQLALKVESSSLHTTPEPRTTGGVNDAGAASERPLFRTFNVSLYPTLRDGQTVQAVASTDPVNGEVVKIDVTLNVVK